MNKKLKTVFPKTIALACFLFFIAGYLYAAKSTAFPDILEPGQIAIDEGGKDECTLFLKPTKYIDSDNVEIKKKTEALIKGCITDAEKAKSLFRFVRDSYTTSGWEGRTAGETLSKGGNSCFSRSILLIALCRAAGIPARLHVQKMVIKSFNNNGNIKDLTFLHGIAGIYINGNWRLYELVGNKDKWNVWTQGQGIVPPFPLRFDPDNDCLLFSNDKIVFETLPVYLSDWSEEKIKRIKQGVDRQ